MNNEEKLTAALDDENKKLFLDFANAWSVVNGESTLDSFIMGFRLGAKFTYDTSLVRMNRCTYDEDIRNAEQNGSPITM